MGEVLSEQFGEVVVFQTLVVLAAEDEGGDDWDLRETMIEIEAWVQ